MHTGVFWLILLPVYVLASVRRAASDQLLTPELDQFIDDTLKEWNSPGGVAIAVVKLQSDGQWQVETKGYGLARPDGTKITEDTMLAIASNSKLFDVFAAGLLISNKTLSPRIDWVTPMASIFPQWDLMDPVAASASTILDLMSHRTGVPAHNLMYNKNDSDVFLSRCKYLRPSLGFRENFQYNNYMYTVLSALPTYLLPHHPSFASYVKENILDPLGLVNATYSYEVASRTGQLAQGVLRTGRRYALDGGLPKWLPFWFTNGGEDGTNILSGAGGVIMTLKEVTVWLRTLLLLGKNPSTGESVIPPEVVAKAVNGVSVVYGTSSHPSLSPAVYGGGQYSYSYQGHYIVEHAGSAPGTKSAILRLPYDGVGLAVFSTDDVYGDNLNEIIKYRIMDSIFDMPVIDWNELVKTSVEVQFNLTRDMALPRPENATMPLPLDHLQGVYTNSAYGNLTLCTIPSSLEICATLAEEAPTALPNISFTARPTLISTWDKVWSTHLELGHFDGLLWNASALYSYGGDDDGPWVNKYVAFEAEFAPDASGFGVTGIWGAASDTLTGNTVQERAEVWFERV